MNGDYIINKTELGLYAITDKDGAIVYIGNSFGECADEIQSGRLDVSLTMCDIMCK